MHDDEGRGVGRDMNRSNQSGHDSDISQHTGQESQHTVQAAQDRSICVHGTSFGATDTDLDVDRHDADTNSDTDRREGHHMDALDLSSGSGMESDITNTTQRETPASNNTSMQMCAQLSVALTETYFASKGMESNNTSTTQSTSIASHTHNAHSNALYTKEILAAGDSDAAHMHINGTSIAQRNTSVDRMSQVSFDTSATTDPFDASGRNGVISHEADSENALQKVVVYDDRIRNNEMKGSVSLAQQNGSDKSLSLTSSRDTSQARRSKKIGMTTQGKITRSRTWEARGAQNMMKNLIGRTMHVFLSFGRSQSDRESGPAYRDSGSTVFPVLVQNERYVWREMFLKQYINLTLARGGHLEEQMKINTAMAKASGASAMFSQAPVSNLHMAYIHVRARIYCHGPC